MKGGTRGRNMATRSGTIKEKQSGGTVKSDEEGRGDAVGRRAEAEEDVIRSDRPPRC